MKKNKYSMLSKIEENKLVKKFKNAIDKLHKVRHSFDFIHISIASPFLIKKWSTRKLPTGNLSGKITEPEFFDEMTGIPKKNGLFCQTIFGPMNDWSCGCGKYKKGSFGFYCEDCNVEFVNTSARKYRMGYIELFCPVIHTWYYKGYPNYFNIISKIGNLDKYSLIYAGNLKKAYHNYVTKKLRPVISTNAWVSMHKLFKNHFDHTNVDPKFYSFAPFTLEDFIFKTDIYSIFYYLKNLNLKSEIFYERSFLYNKLNKNFDKSFVPSKAHILRIRILESFLCNNINPSWIMLITIPVCPTILRPLSSTEDEIGYSGLNETYKSILGVNIEIENNYINKNPVEFLKLEYKKLQGLTDLLLVQSNKNTIFEDDKQNFIERISGKFGLFRQYILGKRVDYSGRSVIVTDPLLKMSECGIPFHTLVQIFEPLLKKEIEKKYDIKEEYKNSFTNSFFHSKNSFLWKSLKRLIKKYVVILNRAPTLHSLNVQGYNIVLVESNVIKLHPLYCAGFNADFDGDQMAVHLPMYKASQLEIKNLMKSMSNLFLKSNGELSFKLSQDVVIGCYYLSLLPEENIFYNFNNKPINFDKNFNYFDNSRSFLETKNNFFINYKKISFLYKKIFKNISDAICHHYIKKLELHEYIFINLNFENFHLYQTKDNLIFFYNFMDTDNNFIDIFDILELNIFNENIYFLLTNFGILILKSYKEKKKIKFRVLSFLYETTIGKLIFYTNAENTILQTISI